MAVANVAAGAIYSAPSEARLLPPTLAQTVERLATDGACRLSIATDDGRPLVEIAVVAPVPLNLVRRIVDAVEGIAEAAADEIVVAAQAVPRRPYRGANNWVARARLRTSPSRLEP